MRFRDRRDEKMGKKLLKVIIISISIIITIFSLQLTSYADNDEVSLGESAGGVSSILNTSDYKPSPAPSDSFNSKIATLLSILQVVGVIAIVVGISIMGFNTIMGSAEEKAVEQKKAIGLIVGAVMIFGVTTIAKFIISTIE